MSRNSWILPWPYGLFPNLDPFCCPLSDYQVREKWRVPFPKIFFIWCCGSMEKMEEKKNLHCWHSRVWNKGKERGKLQCQNTFTGTSDTWALLLFLALVVLKNGVTCVVSGMRQNFFNMQSLLKHRQKKTNREQWKLSAIQEYEGSGSTVSPRIDIITPTMTNELVLKGGRKLN